MIRLVVLCSPFRGDTARNLAYARAALADSLRRGEAPIAPHVLYTLPGVLRDDVPEERELGMEAGRAILELSAKVAVYQDLGISEGMRSEIALAEAWGVDVEYRSIKGW